MVDYNDVYGRWKEEGHIQPFPEMVARLGRQVEQGPAALDPKTFGFLRPIFVDGKYVLNTYPEVVTDLRAAFPAGNIVEAEEQFLELLQNRILWKLHDPNDPKSPRFYRWWVPTLKWETVEKGLKDNTERAIQVGRDGFSELSGAEEAVVREVTSCVLAKLKRARDPLLYIWPFTAPMGMFWCGHAGEDDIVLTRHLLEAQSVPLDPIADTEQLIQELTEAVWAAWDVPDWRTSTMDHPLLLAPYVVLWPGPVGPKGRIWKTRFARKAMQRA